MKMQNVLYFPASPEWHAWLEQHHTAVKVAWLVFYKAVTGKPCLEYEDAVEEALCFGWIDSIIQKIDDESYARKFTPRTNSAKWSVTNRRRVAKLLREGRMTPAGMACIADLSGFREDLPDEKPKELEIPASVEQGLRSSPLAWENFCKMAPSYRRIYIGWISDAKRPETVAKRLREAVERLEKNLPLGMK